MKQILLINDIVGYSHVGMVAMLPILTYMGHQTFNLPTALVSNTLDYGQFNIMETTDYMKGTLPVWQQLGVKFDAACTGLMFSEEQAQLVATYCRHLRENGTSIFVDPIMGDNGRLYNGITHRQIELMREMVSVADIILPNYTEACLLAGIPFNNHGISHKEAQEMLDILTTLGTQSVIVTSAIVDGHSCVIGKQPSIPIPITESNQPSNPYFKLDYEELPVSFHGTGDPNSHDHRQQPHRPQPPPNRPLHGHPY